MTLQTLHKFETYQIQEAVTLQYPESQAVLFSEGRLASRHDRCWGTPLLSRLTGHLADVSSELILAKS